MNELIVESKGHCFLCLKQISFDLKLPQPTLQNSLQYLSRYLHIDMRKVFRGGGQGISPELLDKVQKSNIKVELCHDCVKLNNEFSAVYCQLEKIQMEVKFKLDLIHLKMTKTEEQNNHTFLKMLASEPRDYAGKLAEKLKITDALRNEAIEKCSIKLSSAVPRVKVQKSTSDELMIHAEKLKARAQSRRNAMTKYLPFHDLVIKKETIPLNILPDLDDAHSFSGGDDAEVEYEETQLTGDLEAEEKFAALTVECNICHLRVRKLSSHQCSSASETKSGNKRKLNANGKKRRTRHQCDKCAKSFCQSSHLKTHELSSHQGIRPFFCDQCDLAFTQSGHLKSHKLNIHQGKRFYCNKNKCGRQFTSQSNLRRHVITIHCGQRFQCNFCTETFPQSYDKNIHMKNKCLKRKKTE